MAGRAGARAGSHGASAARSPAAVPSLPPLPSSAHGRAYVLLFDRRRRKHPQLACGVSRAAANARKKLAGVVDGSHLQFFFEQVPLAT